MMVIRILDVCLRIIGGTVLLALAVTGVCLLMEKIIVPAMCNHRYKVVGSAGNKEETVYFLECENCGKEINICLCDGFHIYSEDDTSTKEE